LPLVLVTGGMKQILDTRPQITHKEPLGPAQACPLVGK
jgi:hypothetical protein